MAFLRVVEVFPPILPRPGSQNRQRKFETIMGRFTTEIDGVRDTADLFLVANVKNPVPLKMDPVFAAAKLQEALAVRAAPTVVVRDHNRAQFDSVVFTALAAGLESIFLAWGDDYPAESGITNVRDFASLADALRVASLIKSKVSPSTRLLAPVDLRSLASSKGIMLAKERLNAGAKLLLAQPPTTDPGGTFDMHASLVAKAGLKDKVLLGVFPFRNESEVRHYERLFGWELPKRVHEEASEGEERAIKLSKDVAMRLREEGHPGVYLVTRGRPWIAPRILA